VTTATLVLGYPLAFWLARVRLRRKGLLLLLVLFPWLTSVIIRTYAWMILLGNEGLLNKTLGLVGAGPVRLLWRESGVIVGLVYVMLPLMVIPLYNAISQVDRRTEDAARSLGATEWTVFRRITWPLTRPGVVSGCLLVFIVTVGSYVTPALLGGPRETVMPMLVEQQVTVLHYPFAAVLGVMLLGIVLLVTAVFNRYLTARLAATVT
jgi:ABC-type spermidine/putrescine transport system permease subunit I